MFENKPAILTYELQNFDPDAGHVDMEASERKFRSILVDSSSFPVMSITVYFEPQTIEDSLAIRIRLEGIPDCPETINALESVRRKTQDSRLWIVYKS